MTNHQEKNIISLALAGFMLITACQYQKVESATPPAPTPKPALNPPGCPAESGFRFQDLNDLGRGGFYDRTLPAGFLLRTPTSDICGFPSQNLRIGATLFATSRDSLAVAFRIGKEDDREYLFSHREKVLPKIDLQKAVRFVARWKEKSVTEGFINGQPVF